MRNDDLRALLTGSDDSALKSISAEYPAPFDQEKLFLKSYAKFQGTPEQPGVRRPLWRRTALRAWTAAACLMLSVGLGAGVWAKQQRIDTRPPQEVPAITSTETTRTTETTAETKAQTTVTHTTKKKPETTAQVPETTAAASGQTTAVTNTGAIQTIPASVFRTTAAAPVTTFTAVQTVPAYQPCTPQSKPVSTETTVLQTTEGVPDTTAITETRATLPVQTLPYNGNKEELWMKVTMLKKMQAVISAAASTAALATMPAATTAAAAETTVTLTEPSGIVTQYGDVNLDKSVSMSDLVQLQRFLLGQGDGLDYWMNGDICEDGVIDIYDLAMLKKELIGDDHVGGTLTVRVVDMMTGEPLEHASVDLIGLNVDCAYDLSQWHYDPAKPEDSVICGLPTDSSYSYMLELHDLPAGYGGDFGNWDQQYMFSFDEGERDKEITLRVLADNEDRNVKINIKDWASVDDPTMEDRSYYGMMCVTDKDGIPYYPYLHSADIALPDGEYHVYISPFEMPVQMLTPDSTFTKVIHELYPDVTITDQSKGLDFAVRDGKPDREIQFDFGPCDNTFNHVTVRCVDAFTGEPLAGAELSLIASPKDQPWTVQTWITDETGTKTIDDLILTGYPGYIVRVDKAPEGYTGGFDQGIYFPYINEYDMEMEFRFTPGAEEPNFSADILNWDDRSVINDAATYEIWCVEGGDPTYMDSNNLPQSTKIMEGVKPGEKVALKDGDYFAVLDYKAFHDKGLESINCFTYVGKAIFEENNLSLKDFMSDTSMVNFTIKDGKPDRAVVFYLREADSGSN